MLGLDCMCCISQLRSATWDHAGGTQAQCAIHGTKKLGIAVSCITGHITPVFEVLAVTRAHSNISRRSASPRNFVLVASLSLRRSASGSSTVDNMYAATELLISSNSLLNPAPAVGNGQTASMSSPFSTLLPAHAYLSRHQSSIIFVGQMKLMLTMVMLATVLCKKCNCDAETRQVCTHAYTHTHTANRHWPDVPSTLSPSATSERFRYNTSLLLVEPVLGFSRARKP